MPYELYKVIHLAAIFVFLSGAAVMLLGRPQGPTWKIVTGVSSLLILVAGFGLLARIGGGMPPWIHAKLTIWLVITALGHVVAKRFPQHAAKAYGITMVLAVFAAYLAVYKPF